MKRKTFIYKIKMGLKWFLARAVNWEAFHNSFDYMVYVMLCLRQSGPLSITISFVLTDSVCLRLLM